MVIKREVAYGIVQGLSEFWNCEELQDFTVNVDKRSFGCHKLVLAACSGFFRALFRSGMKETKLNCVILKDISSETFQLILETIYTGHGVLTNDNVIDIWRAANQLQITFMVTECEKFVINSLSLENYIQYYQCGKLLSSEIVTEIVWNFILQHCDLFFTTSFFLELPFEEVLNLIKNQYLAASTEDEVLKAILNWVEFKPEQEFQNDVNCLHDVNKNTHTMSQNIKSIERLDTNCEEFSCGNSTAVCLKDNTTFNNNLMSCDNIVSCEESVSGNKTGLCDGTLIYSDNRKQNLFDLLSNARTCLASHGCLEMLLRHPLVSQNKQAMDFIDSAISYQIQKGKRNGQWPTGVTHRNKSEQENVAIMMYYDSELLAYSFSKDSWSEYKSAKLFERKIMTEMVTVDNSLYCLCVKFHDDFGNLCFVCPFLVYRLTDSNEWSLINNSLKLYWVRFSVVAVDDCIYIVQLEKLWKLDTSLQTMVSLCDLPDSSLTFQLISYDQTIIAFKGTATESDLDPEETAVFSFDILKNTWTHLNNIDGPAYGMTSFKVEHTSYLLQSNGNLWKLVKPQSGVVDFELVAKLWRCDWPLDGAVIFLDELYLYGTSSEIMTDDLLELNSVAGLFKTITFLEYPETCSLSPVFVPFIVDKKLLEMVEFPPTKSSV